MLVVDESGQEFERIPIWSQFMVFNNEKKTFEAVFWNPEKKFEFKEPKPEKPRFPKIYDAHVGIAGSEMKIHSYSEFAGK